jgi:uroporphyrinogen decarboxylase
MATQAGTKTEMTHTERVRAAVNGGEVDRVPVAFWHHFRPEGSGTKMARATYHFFVESFDLDIAKIMPDIPYPFPRQSIHEPNDWRLIEPIDPLRSRFFTQRAEAVIDLRQRVGNGTPIIVTVFSPMTEAMHFAPSKEQFIQLATEHPAVVHEALATIAGNLRQHISDVIDAGADGVFFALQGCTTDYMTPEQYKEFGRPYDLMALAGAENGWLNILHIHGEQNLMFNEMLDYPTQVLNWSDRLAGPSLREARAVTNRCLMGGWNEFGPLSNGPAEKIKQEADDALKQTGGRRFILANGCSVPDDTDERWLRIARDYVNDL